MIARGRSRSLSRPALGAQPDDGGDGGQQRLGGPGFGDRLPIGGAARPDVRHRSEAGRVDDLHLRLQLARLAGQGIAVKETGHRDVGDEQPKRQALLKDYQRDVAVDRGGDPVALVPQDGDGQFENRLLVTMRCFLLPIKLTGK